MVLSFHHLVILLFEIHQFIAAGSANPDAEKRSLVKWPNDDIVCGPFYGNPVDTACDALLGVMIELYGANAIAPFGQVTPPPEPGMETEGTSPNHVQFLVTFISRGAMLTTEHSWQL